MRENIDTLAADGELANKKLAEMNSELAKAQEHAKRFQDLLAVERRKQKTLQVHTTSSHTIAHHEQTVLYMCRSCSIF